MRFIDDSTGQALVATNMNIDDSTGPALVGTTPGTNLTGPTLVATKMILRALPSSTPAAKYFIICSKSELTSPTDPPRKYSRLCKVRRNNESTLPTEYF